jgi:hypothetical protein
MRINVDRDSPHFWRRHFVESWPLVITVDGQSAPLAIEADDAVGYVEILSTGACGTVQKCHCGERLMSGLVFGRVEIVGKFLNG